jgi:hypothetical protein
MKIKLKFLILSLFLVFSFLIFYKLEAEKLTGKFILVSSYVGILFTLSVLLFFSSVLVKEKKPELKLIELWRDLFKYSDKIAIGKKEELREEFYKKAREFVEEAREIAKKYDIKLNILNQDNAKELVSALIFKMYDIKHRAAHPGARYVHEMRENPYDLRATKAALKFLTDLKPEIYGKTAEDIYELMKKLYH